MALQQLANAIKSLAPPEWLVTLGEDQIVVEPNDRSLRSLAIYESEFLTDRVFIGWGNSGPWIRFEKSPVIADEIVRLIEEPYNYVSYGESCPACDRLHTLLGTVFCESCGIDIRRIQGMPRLKQDVAWLVAGQLNRGRAYHPNEIDRIARTALRPDILSDPTMAPDHLRIAMVEAGYVVRDALGLSYRIADNYVGPADLEQRAGELQRLGSELAFEHRAIRCPVCGTKMRASQFAGHCQSKHGVGDWCLKMYEAYGR